MTPLFIRNLETLTHVHWSVMACFFIVFVACLLGMSVALRSKALTSEAFKADPFAWIGPCTLALCLALPLAWSGVTVSMWLFANFCWKG